MRILHLTLAVSNIEESVADYTGRLAVRGRCRARRVCFVAD